MNLVQCDNFHQGTTAKFFLVAILSTRKLCQQTRDGDVNTLMDNFSKQTNKDSHKRQKSNSNQTPNKQASPNKGRGPSPTQKIKTDKKDANETNSAPSLGNIKVLRSTPQILQVPPQQPKIFKPSATDDKPHIPAPQQQQQSAPLASPIITKLLSTPAPVATPSTYSRHNVYQQHHATYDVCLDQCFKVLSEQSDYMVIGMF